MGLQTLWLRILAVSLGSSVYALSTVLATYILGMAAGSLMLSSRVGERMNSPGSLVFLALIFCGAAGLSVDHLPYWFGLLRLESLELELSFATFNGLRFFAVFLLLLPVTCVFGAALPVLAMRATSREEVSNIFAMNTLGAVLGAMTTLTFVVPRFHLHGAYIGILLLGILLCVLLVENLKDRGRIFLAAFAACLTVLFVSSPFDPYPLSSGTFRFGKLASSYEQFHQQLVRSDIVFYKDGADASVAVWEKSGNRVLR